jgi:SAM-dependent methyltransferase
VEKSEYARLAEYEQSYWWHQGRLEIIKTYMRWASRNRPDSAILNVGCDTGGTIGMLEKFGTVDNVDTSDDAITFARRLGHGNITKVDDVSLPFKDKVYDIVGAFDVLEHIADQKSALSEWKRVLKDDGAIVMTVPAYQWLWSRHDIAMHHWRRYTMRSLTTVAAEVGLMPERKSYAISFSLPLVAGFRLVSKILDRRADSESSFAPLPRAVNKFFTALLRAEAKLHNVVSLPAGSSLITILRKS